MIRKERVSEKVRAGKHVRGTAELRASAFKQGARLGFHFLLEVRAGAGSAEADKLTESGSGTNSKRKRGKKVRYKSSNIVSIR